MGLKTWWTDWYQRLIHAGTTRRLRREKEAVVLEKIEQIVREIDPRILSLDKFRKQLIPPVQHSLNYISRLMTQVPGPVDLNPEHWDDDPLLKGLFVDPEELFGVLRSSKELKNFVKQTDAPRVFALLIVNRKKKTVF